MATYRAYFEPGTEVSDIRVILHIRGIQFSGLHKGKAAQNLRKPTRPYAEIPIDDEKDLSRVKSSLSGVSCFKSLIEIVT
jgi:hypothetical protein